MLGPSSSFVSLVWLSFASWAYDENQKRVPSEDHPCGESRHVERLVAAGPDSEDDKEQTAGHCDVQGQPDDWEEPVKSVKVPAQCLAGRGAAVEDLEDGPDGEGHEGAGKPERVSFDSYLLTAIGTRALITTQSPSPSTPWR